MGVFNTDILVLNLFHLWLIKPKDLESVDIRVICTKYRKNELVIAGLVLIMFGVVNLSTGRSFGTGSSR